MNNNNLCIESYIFNPSNISGLTYHFMTHIEINKKFQLFDHKEL